jgi:hypothetical protein
MASVRARPPARSTTAQGDAAASTIAACASVGGCPSLVRRLDVTRDHF